MKTVNELISVELYRNANPDVLEMIVRRLLSQLPGADVIEMTLVDFELTAKADGGVFDE